MSVARTEAKQPIKAPNQRIRRGQKPDNPTATTNRGGSRGARPPGQIASPVPAKSAESRQAADQSPNPTDPTRTEARQPNRNHQSRGIPGGSAPRAKSLAPSRRSRPKAGKQPTKAPTQRIRRGQKPDNPTATTNRGGSRGARPPGQNR